MPFSDISHFVRLLRCLSAKSCGVLLPAASDFDKTISLFFCLLSYSSNILSLSQLVTLPEAKLLLNEDDYLLKSVYDYWVRKRKGSQAPSLIPSVKQEKRDGSTNNDAYVAFRRRTEKMQTRKVHAKHVSFQGHWVFRRRTSPIADEGSILGYNDRMVFGNVVIRWITDHHFHWKFM